MVLGQWYSKSCHSLLGRSPRAFQAQIIFNIVLKQLFVSPSSNGAKYDIYLQTEKKGMVVVKTGLNNKKKEEKEKEEEDKRGRRKKRIISLDSASRELGH